MSDWQPIETAPIDRPIIGMNEAGDEAEMFSQKVHPKVDVRFWCKGEGRSHPNWTRRECFYPVKWRERDTP